MKIIVCIKSVPNPEQYDKIQLDPVRKTVVREGIDSVINSADLHAIELAMQLKEKCGAKIQLLSMGPLGNEKQLREGLSYGCDEAYLVSDRKFGGADSLATCYTLAESIKKIGIPDLVLLGNVSEDGATAHVPSQLGELLNLPHLTDVIDFELKDEGTVLLKKAIGKGIASFSAQLPAVLGIDRKLNTVRHPNVMGIFSAKNKPLTVLTAADFEGLDETKIGLIGSPTQPGEYRDVEYSRECKELKDVSELMQIINKVRR